MATATAPDVTKIAEGGSSPFTDNFRRHKYLGNTTSTMTNTLLGEAGAGFWNDMAKQAARLGTALVIP